MISGIKTLDRGSFILMIASGVIGSALLIGGVVSAVQGALHNLHNFNLSMGLIISGGVIGIGGAAISACCFNRVTNLFQKDKERKQKTLEKVNQQYQAAL